ncbi:hypothetical protein J0S82_003813 [Galemys pyrenaicus]|uniref:Uncharacterized protein n=1 Tax=Galemys pyrenaicus TaxID=202257 RepID=A0A8J6A5H6_GALPY|nr:hypothetical protein J0S82_003813 [Galemys pyrenaicus]
MTFNPFLTWYHSTNSKSYFNVPSCVHRRREPSPRNWGQVYRKKQAVYTEWMQVSTLVGIHLSRAVIIRLKSDKDQDNILEEKAKS